MVIQLFALVVTVVAWLLPNHYPPWYSIHNEAAMAVALALWMLSIGGGWRTGRISTVVPVVLVVALIPPLQLLFGPLVFADDAWLSSVYLVGLATAIATGQLKAAASHRQTAAFFALAALSASMLSALLALFQGLQLSGLEIYALDSWTAMRPYANLGQPNNLGTLLGLGVLGTIVLFEQRLIGPFLGTVLVGTLIVGAGLTQSKTALLYGPLILGCWCIARHRRVVLRTPISAVALASALHWLMTSAWPIVQQRLLLASNPSISSRSMDAGRLDAWRLFIDATWHSPWAGYGWLQTAAAQSAVALDHPPIRDKIWFQSHNLFLDLVLWNGWPLGLLLSAACLCWLGSRLPKVRTPEGVVGLLVVILVGTHAMLELPLHYAYFLIPVGLWVGIVEADIAAARTISARWLLAPAVLAVGLLAEAGREYPALEEDFRLVRFQNLRIGNVRSTRPAPEAPLFPSLTAYLQLVRSSIGPGMDEDQIRRLLVTAQRYPYSIALFKAALALAYDGRLEEARTAFILLRHIHGEGAYAKQKLDLHEQIVNGALELAPFEKVLP